MNSAPAEHTFTHAYFMGEARAFLQQMGNLSFWRLPEDQRENALKGLLYCYTHAESETEDERESRGVTMRMVTDDFARRSTYALFHPKLRDSGITESPDAHGCPESHPHT